MRKCPECSEIYENSYNFCLHHGKLLVEDLTSEYPTLAVNRISDLISTKKIIVPTVKKLKYKIDEAGHQKSYTHSIEYPQIKNLENDYIENRINLFFKKEFVFENKKYDFDDDFSKIEKETGFEIGVLTSNVLSLLSTEYTDFGGAHPAWDFKTYNVDFDTGYNYIYHDLFKANSDYLTRIPKLICLYLDTEEETENEEVVEDSEIIDIIPDIAEIKDYDFYITEEKLIFVNLSYSFVNCWRFSRIPYSEIVDIIHPQGPLQQFLK